MNKIETNALRIAELMGWWHPDANGLIYIYCQDDIDYSSGRLIMQFSAYQYLMPIVFKCNIDINYRIHIYEECVVFSTADGEMLLPKLKYDTEPEFIEAIQLACIKYLELRNANSRIQQTI